VSLHPFQCLNADSGVHSPSDAREALLMDKIRASELDEIESYPAEVYMDVDLTGLTAFTLSWLQDRNIPTTFESVVVAAFKMFPNKFSLEGYSQYPDAARIGRTLLQLGPKYRNWVRGSVQKGFVLTESGRLKVEKVHRALERKGQTVPIPKRSTVSRTMDMAKELAPLEHSPLFDKWKLAQLEQGTSLELLNMLGAYAYTPPKALADRLAVLENAATHARRDDLADFLKAIKKTFAMQLRDRSRDG
jgi:hypothetical protein